MKPTIYIITCDKTNHILKLVIPLFDKYWNIEKNVKILGFSKPEMVLPSDYSFISMKPKQLSIDDWGKDIATALEKEEEEHIIFMLDDFTPIDYIKPDIINKLCSLIENDDKIVRCSLGSDLYYNSPHRIIDTCDDYSIIEQTQESTYRITCQPSIWKRQYLTSFLKRSTNPWHFETANNPRDGFRMIGTKDKYAYRWIKETALSARHPNKINILGMRFSDIKWAIENNILNPDDLQYGQWIGNVPQFKDYGYDFKIEILKSFANTFHYNMSYKQYEEFYR
jgi:hypothetical protein